MSLSKTAAAAQKAVERGQQQAKEAWTPERTIKNIRQLREARLAVPIDQIDVLLAEYDKLIDLTDALQNTVNFTEEKRKGQLDIVLRTLQQDCDEEEAFLANDYGGLGWELDPQVLSILEFGSVLKGKLKIPEEN